MKIRNVISEKKRELNENYNHKHF